MVTASTVSKRKSDGLTVVDLFAGCGGLSLGLELAGFRPILVNELHEDAMATYLANRLHEFPHLGRHRYYDVFDLTAKEVGGELVARSVARDLRDRFGDVGLVVGGPPCQGYSGIGHRRTFTGLMKVEIPSNHLYRDMATLIREVRPRAFLFENVKGLLTSKWTVDGTNGEIWDDVRRTFEGIDGYYVNWKLVHAKQYGVPQNRPRVLLIGIRDDLGFRPRDDEPAGGLLPRPEGRPPDPVDFLGDLEDVDYLSKDATEAYPQDVQNEVQEEYRRDFATGRVSAKGDRLTEHEYSRHADRIREKFQYMLDHDGEIRPEDQTKKFAQRVIPREWGPGGPMITATSLPDDYVHYSQPRILTVREWARLQTFPDWYQFAGKRTTGGRRRAGDPDAGDWSRELPKYTQIGNAVPVWLARAVGEHLRGLIR